MNVVLVMFRDDERRDFPVSQERTVLGRRQDCHLRIPTRDVSRQHCELLVEGDALLVRDLGSSNGTFVNGKRIAESELTPGDQLRIGPVTFIVQIDGQPSKIQPLKDASPTSVVPTAAGQPDEKTFELGEGDFDLDGALSDLEIEDEEQDMP